MPEEHGYMQSLVDHMDAALGKSKKPKPLKWVEQGFGGDTPNKKGLKAVLWYLDRPQTAATREKLLVFFDTQEGVGHQTIGKACEILSATHDQLHCAYAAMALWGGIRHGDQPVIDAATRWWQSSFALWESLAHLTAEGHTPIVAPGARAWKGGQKPGKEPLFSNPVRDLCYSIVYGTPLPPGFGKNWIRDRYNIAGRALLALSDEQRRKLRPTPDHQVPMAYGLRVARYEGGDFLAVLEETPAGMQATRCAGVEGGVPWCSGPLDHAQIDRYAELQATTYIEFPATAGGKDRG